MKNKNLFKINLIYFIIIVAFVIIRIFSSLGVFNFLDSEIASGVFTIIIQVGVMFILPMTLIFLILKKGIKGTFEFLGFKKISLKSVFIAVLIGALAFFLNLAVSTVFNGLIAFFGYNPTGSGETIIYDTLFKFIRAIVFIAVLPSIFEEITHRGLLLKGYAKEIGYRRAIVYSSLLFGLMHLNVGQVFYATVLGALIGVTAIVSGSIFPAMIVHFMNNAINVYLVYAGQNNFVGKNFYNNINSFLQNTNPAITFTVAFTFLGLLVLMLTVLILKLYKEHTIKNLTKIKDKLERTLDSHIFEDERIPEAGELAIVNSVLTEKLRPLIPDFSNIKSPLDIMLPETEQDEYVPSILENIFFYGSVFLGVLITMFTFIWGVVW